MIPPRGPDSHKYTLSPNLICSLCCWTSQVCSLRVHCTPNVGEFRAGLKDPGVPAVCCGTYRLFLLLFALCPVLSRPFPQNMRMRNAPRRNPVRPTGFLSYASHCSVGVDSIACQSATGLDDLMPGAFHGITHT